MKKVETKRKAVTNVKLWERLELKLAKGTETATFVTRVEDFDGDNMVVEKPVRLSGALDLAIGQTLEAVFNRQDAAYVFKAVVADIDSAKEDMTTLKPVSKIERTQRRKFVRIDIAGKMTFRMIDLNEKKGGLLGLEKKGTLLNISAGGVLISTDQKLKPGDYLLINFWLKSSQRLNNILGLTKRVDQEDNEYLVGVEFIDKEQKADCLPASLLEVLPPDTAFFDDALQKLVIQFVYKQQIELRKKGSLKEGS